MSLKSVYRIPYSHKLDNYRKYKIKKCGSNEGRLMVMMMMMITKLVKSNVWNNECFKLD